MLTDARIRAMLDAEFTTGDLVSAHTAFSLTGANEVSGGSYARQSITWAAASGRSKASSGNMDIPIPAGATVSWLGIWNSAGTVFKGMSANGGTEKSFQLDTTANERILCEAHGYTNGQQVAFIGTTVPGGTTAGTAYFVVGSTAADPDYFSVSATSGGAAINLTAQHSADARVSLIVPETYASAGTHRVTSLTTSL